MFLVLALAGGFTVLALRFTLGGSEDTWLCQDGQWVKHGNPSAAMPVEGCGDQRLIGGDKDEHGCLIAAGYSWCEAKQKCLRIWEEKCEVPAADESTTVSLDETWNQYTNPRLGFSLKVPKIVYHSYGACNWTTANGDHSYRPQVSAVPVKIFEDGDDIFISTEFYYELTDKTQEGGRSFFNDCQRAENSTTLLKDPGNFMEQKWRIVVQEVADEAALEDFLQERYGAGCRLGSQKPTDQEGVYDVVVEGDGKDISETACPVNFRYVVKYSPEKGKVIAWDLGQAVTFWADYAMDQSYDEAMVQSFRFE